MVCPYCGQKTHVTNSRHQKRNNQVWRRRQCANCLVVFTSLETLDLGGSLMVEKNGALRPFVNDFLFVEVLMSLSDRKSPYIDARELTNTIIQELLKQPNLPVISTKAIGVTTAGVLRRFDKRAWHRYTAEHPSLTS